MNIILPWLIVVALIVTIVAVSYAAIKDRKEYKTEIARLNSEIEAQKRISTELRHYAEEISKINGDKEEVSEKIKEAKNDEEVMSIIAGLVRANNDRVRK